jgi:hypothetical protein
MKSRHQAGTPNYSTTEELGSTTLTVAVLILFVGLVLTAFFLLVMAGLTLLTRLTRLALSILTRLTTLLPLPLLLHIVCHKNYSPEKARNCSTFKIYEPREPLVAAKDCKGWDRILCS